MALVDVVINMIIVAIPEEIFFVLLGIILMGRFEFISRKNIISNTPRILLLGVIPCVIFFNLILFRTNLYFYIRVPLNILVFAICLALVLKSNKIFKALLSSMIVIGLVIFVEMIWSIIYTKAFNVDLSLINHYPWVNFMFNLPVRVIQYWLLYMVYLKKDKINNVSIFKIWALNKSLRKYILFFLSVDVVIFLFVYSRIAFSNILDNMMDISKIVFITAILMLLIITILIPWVVAIVITPVDENDELNT